MTQTYEQLVAIIKKQNEVISELISRQAEQENLISALLRERKGTVD